MAIGFQANSGRIHSDSKFRIGRLNRARTLRRNEFIKIKTVNYSIDFAVDEDELLTGFVGNANKKVNVVAALIQIIDMFRQGGLQQQLVLQSRDIFPEGDNRLQVMGFIRALIENSNIFSQNRLLYVTITNDDNNHFSYFINGNEVISSYIDNLRYADSQRAGSDLLGVVNTMSIKKLTFRRVMADAPIPGNVFNEGAFSIYYNQNLDIDLSKYGIYRNFEEMNSLVEPCLITAIKHSKLPFGVVTDLISNIKTRWINIYDLTRLFRINKVNLTVYLYNYKAKIFRTAKYVTGFKHGLKLGLYEKHYFIIDQTKYTTFAISHYNELKDIFNWGNIIFNGSRIKRSNLRFLKSHHLIAAMLNNDMLTKIPKMDLAKTPYWKEFKNIYDGEADILEYNPDTCTKDIKYTVKKHKFEHVYTADFESQVQFNSDTEDNYHLPYMCSVQELDIDFNSVTVTKTFFEKRRFSCVSALLNEIKPHSVVYFHNLGYDFQFIMNDPKTWIIGILKKGGTVYSATVSWYGKRIDFRCSYALIKQPLRKFPDCFGLKELDKEIMPYETYRQDEIMNGLVLKPIKDALKYISSKSKRLQFVSNLMKLNLCVGDKFLYQEYAKYYCERDVDLLSNGLRAFKNQIHEICDLNVINYLTLGAISLAYFTKEGCFTGVKKLALNPYKFIMKTMVGGRVMMKDNKKQYTNERVQDFDANALYPSATCRLSGFLIGNPKIIKDQAHFNHLMKIVDPEIESSGENLFVKVKILKIGKRRQFPLQVIKEKGKANHFTNDIEGKIIYVTGIALEDLIKYHDIEDSDVEFIQGYHFDEGRNSIARIVMERLYRMRQKLKIEGNPIQTTYKELMNSFYGKTLQKEVPVSVKVMNNKEQFDKYRNRYRNSLVGFEEYNNGYLVTANSRIDNHFAIPQVGCQILAMSKRIMNEVFCLAEDIKLYIDYQDTDSMHIREYDVHLLDNAFEIMHQRKLIGSNMGQFHCDFAKFNGSEGTVYATKGYRIGKKFYIDKVACTVNDKTSYHIRCAGINQVAIVQACKDFNCDPMGVYKRLYDGKEIDFNLTTPITEELEALFNKYNLEVPSSNVFFKRDSYLRTSNRIDFTRLIHFPNKTKMKLKTKLKLKLKV